MASRAKETARRLFGRGPFGRLVVAHSVTNAADALFTVSLAGSLFFAVSAVMVFAFALVQEGRAPEDGAAGILWIAVSFAGTLALGRTFERERHNDTLRALMLIAFDGVTGIMAGALVLGMVTGVRRVLPARSTVRASSG